MTVAERPVRLVVAGATGRMGQVILRLAFDDAAFEVVGAGERARHAAIGEDAGLLVGAGRRGLAVEELGDEVLRRGEVVVDFTCPAATLALAPRCAALGVGMVIGTTGLDEGGRGAIAAAAARVPIVLSPNMSVGVNAVYGLLEIAARALAGFDVEIVETHHRLKKDAPSGTALEMARVVARALGRDLGEVGRFAREGMVGERPASEIGVVAVRGGDVVGEHLVQFLGAGERVEITHKASTRDIFARGALRAAGWTRGREPGLFDMQAVLGLRR